jgi:non-specific serine/threonine protein kinase/serine/threonine-protein kinase
MERQGWLYGALTMDKKDKENQSRNSHPDDPTLGLTPGAEGTRPEFVGSFRILELLGTGGMGEVYLAEQESPLKRQVALKIIKAGMDTREVIARFETERQALALMNHPNVARMFEAGTTESGRPYFVMEHVPGSPITTFCDEHKLDLRARLELFVPVCRAIQHAHQKGVIHRDIKPSNVLVTMEDDRPVPKVIDFGVAKATGRSLTEKTLFTAQGQLLGTPAYMSPEQAQMTGQDVDTTSDVYSLGVLLYEMLAGSPPFDAQELRQAGIAEINRIIRDVEPPRPSTKISTHGEATEDLAARRRVGPGKWRKMLAGELDWITMRAMAKEPERRYQAASELSSDIERYLGGEPVLARKPSSAYQLKKLISRNKARSLLVFALVAVLVGSSVMVNLQARRIARERDRANQEAETAGRVSTFLVDLFQVADPEENLGNTITAREILDEGVDRIEGELTDQPEIRAKLLQTMGNVYVSLALYEPARELLEEALETQEEYEGVGSLSTVGYLNSLGLVLREKGDFAGAEALFVRAVRIAEDSPEFPREELATLLNSLATVQRDLGDYESATVAFERSLAIKKDELGPNHPDVGASLANWGAALYSAGDLSGARLKLEEALEIREAVLSPDHPDLAASRMNLGLVLSDLGEYEAARPQLERALVIYEKAYGSDHPDVANVLVNLGTLFFNSGDFDSAGPLFERALRIREETLGPDHPEVAVALANVGNIHLMSGDPESALSCYERALSITEASYGAAHVQVATLLLNMGDIHRQLENADQARVCFERAIEIFEQSVGSGHPYVALCRQNIATILMDAGQFDAARPLFEQARVAFTETLGPSHQYTALALYNMACNEALSGDPDRAVAILAEYVKTDGYPGAAIAEEEAFASLRGMAEFEELLETLPAE